MKVLLCLHHRLDPDLGAPGATLALGAGLEREGCGVEYFSFDQAYGELRKVGVSHQLRFPWRAGAFLSRHARDFDVIDASTGDAWVWASLRRPRARSTALVTRAHGLEHIAHESRLLAARAGGARLSWRYPLYHGGLRLWEVRHSLRLSDRCILLNGVDRDYVRSRFSVPEERLCVIPNGIARHFLEATAPEPPHDRWLHLAFVGGWSERKGRRVLEDALISLDERGVEFSVRLLGTGDAAALLQGLPEGLRSRVKVTPHFANEDLPLLLAGQEIFLFPTLFEGASVALLEAMACGLAPIASRVGSAPELVVDGENGVLVKPGDAPAVVAAVERLAGDRARLFEMRRRAQQTARSYSWEEVTADTLGVYEHAVAARSSVYTKRNSNRAL